LGTIRAAIGVFLLSTALCAPAAADDDRRLLGVLLEQEQRPQSPLASDINRQLRTARGIEHDLSLEQSRVNARSASELQRRQAGRDVRVSEQGLRTFKTESPQARSIPLLERRLDRVSRPTGTLSSDPGLGSGFSNSLGLGSGAGTSLGLSGSIGGS
jgi:hypothetical protein